MTIMMVLIFWAYVVIFGHLLGMGLDIYTMQMYGDSWPHATITDVRDRGISIRCILDK